MPSERAIHASDSDEDVVVERSSMGASLVILMALVILAAVWWFALGPGMAASGAGNSSNSVPAGNQPAAS